MNKNLILIIAAVVLLMIILTLIVYKIIKSRKGKRERESWLELGNLSWDDEDYEMAVFYYSLVVESSENKKYDNAGYRLGLLSNSGIAVELKGANNFIEKYGAKLGKSRSDTFHDLETVKYLVAPKVDEEKVRLKGKCHAIIHSASAACAGFGGGLAQIPMADTIPITAAQVAMIIAIGQVYGESITEGIAKSVLAEFVAANGGRAISQCLVGWIPIVGNLINAGTAGGITEALGWYVQADLEKHYFE
ncbi:MAG: hypothetical protein LBN08_06300 [Lactobacillales bacterium]|jgi:uncharacterized protein (DUF697 family)|nr:hypothetical protein [Lactobacillales bacterium]